MEPLEPLNAVSPVDGRYRRQTVPLSRYFSEFALIRYRLHIEIEYFIALCRIPLPGLEKVDDRLFESLRQIHSSFDLKEAARVKEIEGVTNHDVKAVEYYLKEQFEATGHGQYKELVHLGLTSQDINNTAVPMSVRDGMSVMYEHLGIIMDQLLAKAKAWADVPMLARTHGQPASPTSLGKELLVFLERLRQQTDTLRSIPHAAKFGGATGNFNAHHAAYPQVDWNAFAEHFVEKVLGLTRSYPTTQVEHYDYVAALFDNLKRVNTILIDLCRDMWHYISINYFKQKIVRNEVGSSAMPHKVNPIDFENAEGNLGIANSLFTHLAAKLPVSRLQRDLTDSTVMRNIGMPFAHTLIALRSIEKGLNKIELHEQQVHQDLEDNWAVVAEGIQTILRREGYPNPYEALKDLTRTKSKITRAVIAGFIDQLEIGDEIKEELRELTPFTYTGILPDARRRGAQ